MRTAFRAESTHVVRLDLAGHLKHRGAVPAFVLGSQRSKRSRRVFDEDSAQTANYGYFVRRDRSDHEASGR